MSQLEELANEKSEMEMTPMIDVTFLLLIFFMCTLKFKTLEGKLAAYLPKDVGVNPIAANELEKVEVLIRVRNPGTRFTPAKGGELLPYSGQGRFVYGPDRLLEYSLGIMKTTELARVGRRLVELHEMDPLRPLTIDARAGTVYGEVVAVVDSALAANYDKITFVGAYKGSSR